MTVLAGAEALIILVVLCLLFSFERSNRIERADRAKAWEDERRELLNRIQRPDLLPAQAAEPIMVPDREPDEWNRVGEIQVSDKWLNAED